MGGGGGRKGLGGFNIVNKPEMRPVVKQFGQELLKIREVWSCRGDTDPFY